jgi:hypothetical protein
VNGVFAMVDELYNGHPLYQKVGDPSRWLRYCPSGAWAISGTESKLANTDNGSACSVNTGMSFPSEASVWKVAVDGEAVEQAAVRVEAVGVGTK